jgi:hypothetical protein
MSSPITVTLDELARSIDNMGLTQIVSAGLLYHEILQVQASQASPYTAAITAPHVKHSSDLGVRFGTLGFGE